VALLHLRVTSPLSGGQEYCSPSTGAGRPVEGKEDCSTSLEGCDCHRAVQAIARSADRPIARE
jgi:hypothetical protein